MAEFEFEEKRRMSWLLWRAVPKNAMMPRGSLDCTTRPKPVEIRKTPLHRAHHRGVAALKTGRMKMENIDAYGCRMNFNCCSKARTKSNKGGGMKTKTCWKIIILVSPFYDEERNFRSKVSSLGQRSQAKSALSIEDHYMTDFSQLKRPTLMRSMAKERNTFVWEPCRTPPEYVGLKAGPLEANLVIFDRKA